MYRVIIDSNIWVSFLIGKKFRRLIDFIQNRQIIIITCQNQLQELTRTFQKPKLQKYFHASQIESFFTFLKATSIIIPVNVIVPMCRDPKDDYLLALSIISKADYLITGDADLLELQKIKNTIIIKYTNFESLMNEV